MSFLSHTTDVWQVNCAGSIYVRVSAFNFQSKACSTSDYLAASRRLSWSVSKPHTHPHSKDASPTLHLVQQPTAVAPPPKKRLSSGTTVAPFLFLQHLLRLLQFSKANQANNSISFHNFIQKDRCKPSTKITCQL